MAALGLTPEVLLADYLTDGTPLVVQPYIQGRTPSRKDFHTHLEQAALIVSRTHHSLEVMHTLPEAASNHYSLAGLEALTHLRQRWQAYRTQVSVAAGFVDESLDYLEQQVKGFQGTGLVASHNDICNANWLITPIGQLYLLDFESMSQDDPAMDLGALLWWYYPPRLREEFLRIAGYPKDAGFNHRMQIRMAIHCLNILLPREQGFDPFDPTSFAVALTDFKAVLAGEENPQGYDE